MTASASATDAERAGAAADSADSPCCPFCDTTAVELVAPFGSQLLMSQFRPSTFQYKRKSLTYSKTCKRNLS